MKYHGGGVINALSHKDSDMNDDDFTPEERARLRRLLQKRAAEHTRQTQERARVLTAQLHAQYPGLARFREER